MADAGTQRRWGGEPPYYVFFALQDDRIVVAAGFNFWAAAWRPGPDEIGAADAPSDAADL
jgi:hypothetical protein